MIIAQFIKARLYFSDSMGPEELLRDGAFWDVSQVFEEGTLLKVNIHAVTEAVVSLAKELILLNLEWVLDRATALFETGHTHEPHLLGES